MILGRRVFYERFIGDYLLNDVHLLLLLSSIGSRRDLVMDLADDGAKVSEDLLKNE